MPLYVYACQACELELEEMHPLDQVPEKSIRCPLCGGYFERVVTLFQVRGGKEIHTGQRSTQPRQHGPSCVCCFPTQPRR